MKGSSQGLPHDPCAAGSLPVLTEASVSPVLGGWSGVGFILEYDDFEPGDVAFILNVPGGAVDINSLRVAAAAPDLLDALRVLYASFKALADSGDAGFWSLENTDEGQRAIAAIAKAEGRA